MRNLKIFVFLLASSLMINAQKAEAPDFKYDLGGKVEKMTLTSSGVMLIMHGKGLAGIKPGQEGVVFNFDDYGKVKEEEVFIVPNTPYVMVGQAGFGGISAKQSVIDVVTGKRLFDTKANGWKAAGRPTLIMPENRLIVSGQRTAKEKYTQAVGIYDMANGNEIKLFKLKGSNSLTGRPSIINNGVILPTFKGIYRIDMNTGAESWVVNLKNVAYVIPDKDGESMFAVQGKGSNHVIHKLSGSGQQLWSDGKKLKGVVSNFEVTDKGLAIVSNVANNGKSGLAKLASAKAQSNISFLSDSTGEDLWEKAPKTKGYVQHFYIMEDGILFGIGEGGINKISYEGTPLFKKPLKTGANIHTMALTKQGMIYITDTDANIVNLDTGESIWNKPIKYKKAKSVTSTYDEGHARYLISTGEELIAINENNGDISTLASYKFNEKENPTAFQVRENGLLLSSSQNLMMLDFEGKEVFHEYFKSPGQSTFAKIALGALAVASTAMAADASFRAGANRNYIGQYNQYGAQMKRTADMFSAIGTASFNEMAKRFKATSATENDQFILTKLDDGVSLVKVNKDSGEVGKTILLKDKKPVYEVDDFGGYLYYLANGTTVFAYNLVK
ncbi:outer membrane protein assembly factor BamB family protein [Seonamhaeicola marinus]|uniref:PQQ-binding-like beta-propeller repeat protein n=1 Tax=Seonamhaeicola marinus TaxID=1912246 RepID=A0A5D0HUB0_9FLAO|nr:PQQ-binding-like beta-propeller repeat protein [Seonamhaeicola marinus]TYA74983.1 PQQ-binding-like beta-propeller repeat protein [Seonamhaeicola marinus]